MSSFFELGTSAGTDKIYAHGYHRFYPHFLEHIRTTATGMLEIGIDAQNSINLWQKYFINAHIYGIDIGEMTSNDPRTTLIQADQGKIADLERALTKINDPVQFIIDDGSHIPEHQLLTFDFFFNKLLQPGGIYIVEDIETSYWTKLGLYGYETNYGYKHPSSFIERIKPVIDSINSEYLIPENSANNKLLLNGFSDETLSQIGMLTFCQNCIIITKKNTDDNKYNNRQYRFADRL